MAGAVRYTGVLGTGEVNAGLVTSDLAEALEGVTGAVVSLPGFLHPQLFTDLARLRCEVPVVLSPGHTGGALHFRNVFSRLGVPACPVAELSTLPYVCRAKDGAVAVTGRGMQVRCGSLPGHEQASKLAAELFGNTVNFTDVLASSLSNVNLVLHPPGAVAAAAWVEATRGDFTFYVEAMTPGVSRVIDALDAERREVARLFGHCLPCLVEEMSLIGTVPSGAAAPGCTAEAIKAGEANRNIKAPGSLAHRYYKEDFAFGLAPFLALAAVAGARAPVAESLLALGNLLAGDEMPSALDAEALGISGLSHAALVSLVRG
jgi:opine dehydrogenase